MTVPFIPGEVDWLIAINSWHTPLLDAFMYSISNPIAWTPLVVVLLWYLFSNKPWQEGASLIIFLLLCLLATHLLGNVWAKPFFARPRPTLTPEIAEQLHLVYGYTGQSYSFFSGHAANSFAAGTLLALTVGRRAHTILIYLVVSIVAYSRMYQGVHFLSDILVGMLVGIGLGFIFSRLHQRVRRHLSQCVAPTSREAFAPGYRVWLGSLAAFVPLLMLYSLQVAKIISRL